MKWIAFVVLVLAGCASVPAGPLPPSEAKAIQAAETFVARNGYTVSGHPPDLPVLRVEIFDFLSSDTELIKNRKGELGPAAIAVQAFDDATYWVYFPTLGDPENPRIVFVKNGEPQQVFHQSYGPPGKKARRLPPPGGAP